MMSFFEEDLTSEKSIDEMNHQEKEDFLEEFYKNIADF